MTTEVINPLPETQNEKKVRKSSGPRTNSLWAFLQEAFSKNWSYETILKNVGEKFPKSKFNENSEMHFNYYKAKYNMQAKQNGIELSTSQGPAKAPKAAKPKTEKPAKKVSKEA